MKITREKACQRLHHRLRTPLSIQIDGRKYSAIDWSLGGFRIGRWSAKKRDLAIGDDGVCNFELPFQGFNIDFDAKVELVRLDTQGREAAFRFVELTERQIELMSHFIEQLVRGSMTPVQDTILRIDSPVTPVSTKPDPSPLDEVPVKRYSPKKLLMVTLYLVIGAALAVMTSVTVYENFLSLKVKSAVVYAPVEPLVSLVDGRVRTVKASLNSYVNEGDLLFEIESPNLQKRIAEAKIAVEQKKVELQERRKKHALAIDTSGSPASKESRLYEIEVDRLEQEVTLATQQLLALYEYKESLSISSPEGGRLVKLLRRRGALVRRGETLGLFERDLFADSGRSRIHAYIPHREVDQVHIDQQVQVRSNGQRWQGVVVDIQDSHVHLAGQQDSYVPDNVSKRDTLVEIELFPTPESGQASLLRPGMPVEVLFPSFDADALSPKKWLQALWPDDVEADVDRKLVKVTEQGRSI